LSRTLALPCGLAAALFLAASGAPSQQDPQPVMASSTFQTEDTSQTLGPFSIQDQQFTVLLRMKHLQAQRAVPDPDLHETLSLLEIRDAASMVQYRRDFVIPDATPDGFANTTHAHVQALEGKQGSGVLVSYRDLPSTPLGGVSWQVFGLFKGDLVPLSAPLYTEGDLVNKESGGQAVQISEEPGRQGEVLNFRIWTGNFFVIYPVLVDWLQAGLRPAEQCFKMTSQGQLPVCRYRVEAERQPQEEEPTFVRLYDEPLEELGYPEHAVIKKDSVVEILAAEGEVDWQEDEGGVGLAPGGDFWLKVVIDGKEGWIHTQEDFLAIGLPQAG
jgi:hypothetical protein